MLVGVSRDASVCLRCQFHIARAFQCPASYQVSPTRIGVRAQHTAAPAVDDVGGGQRPSWKPPATILPVTIGGDVKPARVKAKKGQHPSKKAEKRLRRMWTPPKVAGLGLSSLGKPAEVLVLTDRDRQVPTMAENGAERAKASQPQILEELQAENVPLTSESIKQSLEQMRAPYRDQSKALPSSVLAELRKKMNGFTQDQLRSYIISDNPSNLVRAAEMQPDGSQTKAQTLNGLLPAEATMKDPIIVNRLHYLGREGLVKYIIKHKWSLRSLEDEHIERRISFGKQNYNFIRTHKQPFLKQCAQRFKVAIDDAKTYGSIHIEGKPEDVSAARTEISDLAKHIVTSHVRTRSAGKDLENFASSDFLKNVAETYSVTIGWASDEDKNMQKHADRLTVRCDKVDYFRGALNAERAILLAERNFLLSKEGDRSVQKISMLLAEKGTNADLVLHQVPEELNGSFQSNVWARWVVPQFPIRMGNVGQEPMSRMSKLNEYWKSLNERTKTLATGLKGEHDAFFPEMLLKRRSYVKTNVKEYAITDEIAVHFGKILFPKQDVTRAEAFYLTRSKKSAALFKAKQLAPAIRSPDLPGVANFLSSLAPWDKTEHILNNTDKNKYARHYRLQYVPLLSQLPSGSSAPTVEIDIIEEGGPGVSVTNHVINAWAILEEQAHRLLIPTFALDLDFARRLKSQLFRARSPRTHSRPKIAWLEKFASLIRNSDSNQFPPFWKVVLPPYIKKMSYPKEFPNSEIDYLLESSELVRSKPYMSRTSCLEHLSFESTSSGNTRESLRLAAEPLLDPNTSQFAIPSLLERAFKIAASISDPQGQGPSGEIRVHSARTGEK